MQQALRLLLAVLAVAPAVQGASLRHGSDSLVAKADPSKPAAIQAKWDKMDGFLKVMFGMACEWKNGKDVNGAAAEKLKDGDISGADGYAQEVKDIQAMNVQNLEGACGMIISESKKDCRDGCAARWNAITGKRQDCDAKCVSVYANFDRSCKSKADNLVKVYNQKSQKAAAQKACYEGHCKEFPQVWMKSSTKEMTDEVKAQCNTKDGRCTKAKIKTGCEGKWALNVGYVTAEVASKCAEDSGMTKCMDKKKGKATTAYDKMKADDKKKCTADHKSCAAESGRKNADAFCEDRRKMCQDQSDAKCLKANKADLKAGESKCEDEDKEALTKCEGDELDKREAVAVKKCQDETAPKCETECAGKCEVPKMKNCLEMLYQKDDPGKVFCQDFWQLLHQTAETDPVTGDPIDM